MKIWSPESIPETIFSKNIHQELNLFKALSTTRDYYSLDRESHIFTIPPTSIEPERAFPAAVQRCNELRSKLSDETLDA